MNNSIDSVIKRLNLSIEKSGLTYVELEKKTGIAKSSIQRYATGVTKKIPIDAIQLIAGAVDVSAAWIMGWEDNDTNSSPKQTLNRQEQVLLDKFRKLNTNGKLKAIESVSDLTEINKYVNHVYIVKEAGRDGSFKDVTVTDEDVEGYYKLDKPSDEI